MIALIKSPSITCAIAPLVLPITRRRWSDGSNSPAMSAARYDKVDIFQGSDIEPQVTWGTKPWSSNLGLGKIPSPSEFEDENRTQIDRRRARIHGAASGTRMTISASIASSSVLARMPHRRLASCRPRRSRLSRQRSSQRDGGSRKWTSQTTSRGRRLGPIFKEAGFDWREAGCRCAWP